MAGIQGEKPSRVRQNAAHFGRRRRFEELRSAHRLICTHPYPTAILEKPPSGGFLWLGFRGLFLRVLLYKNCVSRTMPPTATKLQRNIFHRENLREDQSIRSSRSVCFDEALKRPKQKNMARDIRDIPPNIMVLASINGFSIQPVDEAFLNRAKSMSPLARRHRTIPYTLAHPSLSPAR